MATARDIVKAALQNLGVLASGESADADQSADGLTKLNRLIASWSVGETLLIPSVVKESLSMTGASSYTVGASGDLNTTRPVEIYRITCGATTELPVEIIDADKWAAITDKTLTTSADGVTQVYIQKGATTVTLNVWPLAASGTLNVYSIKPLSEIAAIGDTVSVLPGYERALETNLALELAPGYGREPSASLLSSANESKANIKRANLREYLLKTEVAGLATGKSGFNIYTGE